MAQRKAVATWSGGKDSCLACYKVLQTGYEIVGLLNTISDEFKRVRFHGTEARLIRMQADVISVELLQTTTSADGYEEECKAALSELKVRGPNSLVFADIHLDHCTDWAERVGSEVGLKVLEPL